MSGSVSVKIKGGGFPIDKYKNGVELGVFKDRLNLIYGKNGSGKSAIGKAIAKYSGKVQADEIEEVRFNPEFDEKSKNNIFVFNEQYVKDNLLVREKGPETIAMLGQENVNAALEIERINKIIKETVGKVEAAKSQLDEFKDAFKTIKTQIQDHIKNSGYLDRETAIRQAVGERAKPNVTAGVLEAIVKSVTTQKDYLSNLGQDLKGQFEEKIKLLQNAGGVGTSITWDKPIVVPPFQIEELKELLSKSVLKPELTDREKQIFAILDDNERVSILRQTKDLIIDRKASTCPLCHQDIQSGHFAKLEETVKSLLDDEADRFIGRLKEMRQSVVPFVPVLPQFPAGLYREELQYLENIINKWNGFLQEIRDALTARIENVFAECSYRLDQDRMQEYLDSLNSALGKVDDCKDQFNSEIKNKENLKQRLTDINNLLTGLSVEDIINEYMKVGQNIEQLSLQIGNLEREIEDQNKEKSSMSIQNDEVACEYINRQLANIFYSEDRISLVGTENGEYILHSRGHAVSPDQVSTGERNIIALTYFFASLFRGKSESARYMDPMYVVIDDPISSFDYGNRMGITSYLSMEIRGILFGNYDSKVVVLSHDMLIIRDLCSSVDAVRKFYSDIDDYYYYELRNYGIRQRYPQLWGFKKNAIDDEYKTLLRDVYAYAFDNDDNNDDNGIGNKMRIVLETYSNFMFNKGYKDMLDDYSVLDAVPPKKRDIYKSFFGRFMLDGLSHAQNVTDRLTTFQARYTPEEKKKSARLLLKFLYYSTPQHLAANIWEKEKYAKIEEWEENLQDSDTVA